MNRKWIVISIVVILVVAAGGFGWMRTRAAAASGTGSLEATGTIEARKVALSSEVGGKILEVLVEEGDSVKAGSPLIKLDPTLLLAQRKVAAAALDATKSASISAQAALDAAQSQYDITLNAALSQARPKRTSDWFNATRTGFTKPAWYFSKDEQLSAAQAGVATAKQALTDAQARLATVLASASSADFLKAEQDMAEAQANYLVAKQLNDLVSNGRDINDLTRAGLFKLARDTALKNKGLDPRWLGNNLADDLRTASQDIFDEAKVNLTNSQKAYANAVTTDGAKYVLKARADVSVLQEHYYLAQDLLRSLQTGTDSPAVTAAQKVLDQAKGTSDQTSSAVNQAQANVDLIDVQITKMTVLVPSDGVILTRSVEPGAMAMPGAILLEIGRLDRLELTVYLPEEKFGMVKIGQIVEARVDAYPDRVFAGRVLRMANEAEFTPTNVQTKEDRTRLVYAVVVSLDNPDLALKPGMIADVNFAMGGSK